MWQLDLARPGPPVVGLILDPWRNDQTATQSRLPWSLPPVPASGPSVRTQHVPCVGFILDHSLCFKLAHTQRLDISPMVDLAGSLETDAEKVEFGEDKPPRHWESTFLAHPGCRSSRQARICRVPYRPNPNCQLNSASFPKKLGLTYFFNRQFVM
jgi:hypothetical protein